MSIRKFKHTELQQTALSCLEAEPAEQVMEELISIHVGVLCGVVRVVDITDGLHLHRLKTVLLSVCRQSFSQPFLEVGIRDSRAVVLLLPWAKNLALAQISWIVAEEDLEFEALITFA